MQNSLSNFVLVYGTLKRGGQLNNYLEDSQFVSEITIPKTKKYQLFVPDKTKTILMGFPAVVPSIKSTGFKGEIYKVDDNTLNILDMVEGVPRLYTRRYMFLKINDKLVKVFFYVANFNVHKYNMVPAKEFKIDSTS